MPCASPAPYPVPKCHTVQPREPRAERRELGPRATLPGVTLHAHSLHQDLASSSLEDATV